ncbi:tetratricopeptide repeat protein [Mucilaginibacter flavidus]|uniref:tetratricopeptide repeat protein n=1 Tax=Mucilaginibacter flavidus TaxID=2949309 RepID=UPI0020937F40|nr:tetratricopeptide repeat protein [Mucilaginibacter flavidus]MCO5946219.1 tetratricopeptide repeat protein [Mucilaginibacter flavidus]
MKMISKIAGAGLGLMFLGSSVFAQSLADAKKAIDAEQYQKAKSMLKNLTTTQADKDENYFYLGWVYIKQDYADSAKAIFNKGLAINSKSPLNMVGIGAVAHIEKDNATATNNFNQAIAVAGKNSKPYLYIGLSYLLPVNGSSKGINGSKITPADADAAIAVLTKGKAVNPKDAEILIAMGDAYRSQLKSNDAYTSYSGALAMEKSAAANVALGVLWQYADNFDGSKDQFKAALAIDPNYGPAYREWAETDLRESPKDPTKYDALVKDAAEQYKKYISLTDYSVESQMRYADFLVRTKDYVQLQKVATDLSASAKSNLRAYRYLGYAAFENKDYPAAESALTKWIKEADAKRLLPNDYLYLGRSQILQKKDSVGVQTLRTALTVDTSNVDIYGEIGTTLYNLHNYADAAQALKTFTERSRNAQLNDHFKEAFSYYQVYKSQLIKQQTDKTIKPDTTILAKADTAFSYVERKLGAKPNAQILYFHANVKDFEDGDRNNIKGLAKPFFEQYVQLITAKTTPLKDDEKTSMGVALAYLGNYAENKEKDSAKALDLYTKAQTFDPENPQVKYYFATKKTGGKSK